MKRTLIVIVAFILTALMAAYLLGAFKGSTPLTGTPAASPSSTASQTASSPAPPATKPPAGSPTVQSPTSGPVDVGFTFFVDAPTGSGLTRTFSAKITNTGKSDAHNVWVKIEATSGGSPIQINGQGSFRVDIGIIKAGETVLKQATLEFGMLDSIKIMQNGAQFTLTVYSDEKTQAFGYNYTP